MTHTTLHAPDRVREFFDRLPLDRQSRKPLRRLADGGVAGDWFGCELSSVFQPIVDPARQIVVGHEAFLRCLGGGERDLSPWALFSANADDDRLVALDRLARTVHALNFIASVGGDGLLFLNVHGRLLAAVAGDHGAAFRKIIDALGLPPDRIVIEAPAVASRQVDLLSFVLRNYRHNGFQVAVNVESVEQWQRLSAVVPARFVKIDAATLQEDRRGPRLFDRLHEAVAAPTVVAKRAESAGLGEWPEGALVQGFAYGSPSARPPKASPCAVPWRS